MNILEIVVDPRTGRWYTVGDNGAQFVDIPKGSIVFNHIQSKSLLENGYVSGRASALASGTALVTGAIGLPGVQASTVRKNRIEAEIAKATASEIADSTPDGGSNNPEDSFQYIDRVEILLDRIHRKIDAVKDAISDVFSLWSTRGDNITKQIANITDEIDTQQAAAERYLEEARKQIGKYDLNPEWIKKLETGSISFAYITNIDELYEGYQEYLKWYEKYLDSRDSIAGLERDLSQLYKDQFDNIKKAYENQIDLSEYLRDSEEKTYTQSTEYFYDVRGVYIENLKLLKSEAEELEAQLQKAVDSNAIEVGSEAWQEMRKDINSVTKEIAKTNVELAKLYTEQFDYIQNNYQNQISSYESLHDANEKNFTKVTNYYAEMREISLKTLKAQENELDELNAKFNSTMTSGRIEKNSEAWYKMRQAIDNTTRSIAQTRVALKQLYLDQSDYINTIYQGKISSYASIYDANEKTFTANSDYFDELRDINARTLKAQNEKINKLQNNLFEAMADTANPIEVGSEAWYSLFNSIQDAEREASAARVALKQWYLDYSDYISTGYDNQLSLFQSLHDENEKNFTTTTEYYKERRSLSTKSLEVEEQKLIELQKTFESAMADEGNKIEEGSQAWYTLTNKIDEATRAVAKRRVELKQMYLEEMSYIDSSYKNRISSYESIHDANEKNFTATTDYYDEMREISSKTLAAQVADVEDLRAKFNEAMSDINSPIEKGSEAWYNMVNTINDAARAVAKTRLEIKQLFIEEFNYIQGKFNNELSVFNYYANIFNKRQNLLETQGYTKSGALLYQEEILQSRIREKLMSELMALEEQYNDIVGNNYLDEFSDEWYNLTEKIRGVKDSLLDVNIELAKIAEAKEELAQTGFNIRQDLVSDLKDESDFYISLMDYADLYNKKGQLTDAGLVSLGLHNYNVDVNAGLKRGYDDEIARIDEKYKDDKYNTKYLEYRRELIRLQRESVLAIESEEKAMISMVENGIELELSSLQKLIDKYNESIDAAKDLYDYQNSIAEKTRNVAEIQKQLSAYANDSSEETKATVQKLKVNLEDAQNNLSEAEYSQSIADQKKLLDDMYQEYEKFLNSRLDDRDTLLNELKAAVNTVPGAISEELQKISETVGTPLSDTMANTWEKAAQNIEEWNKTHAEDQQITKQALIDSATTWGSFGAGLITEQKTLNDIQNKLGEDQGKLVTATNNTTTGISRIYGDIGVRGGQTLIEKADEDYLNTRVKITDSTTDINNNISATTGDVNGTIFDNADGVKSTISDKADGIKSTIGNGINDVGGKVDSVEGSIKSWGSIIAELIDGKDFDISFDTGVITGGIKDANDFLDGIDKSISEIAKRYVQEADEHELTNYLGDVDFDKSVTAHDALEILRASAGLQKLTSEQQLLADIDKDSEVTANDALLALQVSTGIHDKEIAKYILEELAKKAGIPGYSSGGLNSETGLAMLHGTKTKPELILKPDDTQNFIKLNEVLQKVVKSQGIDLLGNTFGIDAPVLQLTKMPPIISSTERQNELQDIQIINNIEIDHVNDYNDFVNKLKTDSKFEKMLQSVTINKLNGGRDIDKYKYRW